MNIKETLAASEAHLAINRGEPHRHPEHLALDLHQSALTTLSMEVSALKERLAQRAPAPAKVKTPAKAKTPAK